MNPLRKLSQSAQLLRAYVSLVRDPNQLETVFSLREALTDPERMDAIVSSLRTTERGRRAFADRPRVGTLDRAWLASLPEGTVGRAFSDFLTSRGLDPAALPRLEAEDDATYATAHLYETHDLWHVLTGFDTDVAGELGLQAFYLAQFPAVLAVGILSAGLLNTLLWRMDDKDARMEQIALGWTMGKQASGFFGLRWSELWTRSLDEVRAELSVQPVRASKEFAGIPAGKTLGVSVRERAAAATA